jgi:hypothetical protein
MSKPRIGAVPLLKSKGLLPIDYSIRELCTELGIPDRTARDLFLKFGAPSFRDNRNHIQINGQDFYKWMRSITTKPKRERMTDRQAYCFRCRKPVLLSNPEIIPGKAKLINIRGICPDCGTAINRGGRRNG